LLSGNAKQLHLWRTLLDFFDRNRQHPLQFLNEGLDGLSVHRVTPIGLCQFGCVSSLEQASKRTSLAQKYRRFAGLAARNQLVLQGNGDAGPRPFPITPDRAMKIAV
jgi:hypothetical protein